MRLIQSLFVIKMYMNPGLRFLGPSTLCRMNWKRSLNATVRPTVHTNPSRKRSFSKTLFKSDEEFEKAGFSFSCLTENVHFQNGAFGNNDVTIITWFPWPSFPQTQIQNGRWLVTFLNSSGVVWTEKHLICFQRETKVFKFIRCRVWRGFMNPPKSHCKVTIACITKMLHSAPLTTRAPQASKTSLAISPKKKKAPR